jgi:hypothetical protein
MISGREAAGRNGNEQLTYYVLQDHIAPMDARPKIGWMGDKKYVEDADFASVTVFRHKDAPFSGYVVLGE